MNTVEVKGRTVEDAVASGLEQLGVERSQVEVEILEEPTKGFLGFIGGKDALVRLTKILLPQDIAKELLQPIFKSYGITPEIIVKEEENQIKLEFTGDNLGILIGRRGDTLDALQYWINLSINKHFDDKVKLILDVEGYRKRREETLIKLAKRLSKKVKATRRKIVLEPMNPFERRIIHTALQEENNIQTFSEGDEPFRKVVIAFKR
ncbi:spoIIIJ-associated protein [Desulfitispora alkaliphila]|uniref:RNA-binding cell elongation regulator Jag/EloR n=1 Tax=Desulfitispora alkaliphila TaxID=622674 RepID=UPI003D25AA49